MTKTEIRYPFEPEEIHRIQIAFEISGGDSDYRPECLDILCDCGTLNESQLEDLQYELESIVTESLSKNLMDPCYMDYLQDAECAIESLKYIRFAFDRVKRAGLIEKNEQLELAA